jgi:hypothetical protein
MLDYWEENNKITANPGSHPRVPTKTRKGPLSFNMDLTAKVNTNSITKSGIPQLF